MLLVPATVSLMAGETPLPVVIYSRVADDYERALQADGRPQREHYAIAYGGRAEGTIWDNTQAKEDFPAIAGTLAQELAKENYFFAQGKQDADLLIAIYWGRTDPHDPAKFNNGENAVRDAQRATDAAYNTVYQDSENRGRLGAVADARGQLKSALALVRLENRMGEQRDEETAKVLGYTDELSRLAQAGAEDHFAVLFGEIRDPRYYVLLVAYDFDKIKQSTKKKKPTPRWVTRFSIRTRGVNFMDSIEEMTLRAGRYFGRDSQRLIRDYQGEVYFGDMTPAPPLGALPQKTEPISTGSKVDPTSSAQR